MPRSCSITDAWQAEPAWVLLWAAKNIKAIAVRGKQPLRDVKKYEVQEKVNKIFSWRKDRILKQKKEALSGLTGIEETLNGLKDILESEGHLVELHKENGSYRLKSYNCPISKVANEFNEACMQELQMYRELLNRHVTMEQCMGQGNQSCIFTIPNA